MLKKWVERLYLSVGIKVGYIKEYFRAFISNLIDCCYYSQRNFFFNGMTMIFGSEIFLFDSNFIMYIIIFYYLIQFILVNYGIIHESSILNRINHPYIVIGSNDLFEDFDDAIAIYMVIILIINPCNEPWMWPEMDSFLYCICTSFIIVPTLLTIVYAHGLQMFLSVCVYPIYFSAKDVYIYHNAIIKYNKLSIQNRCCICYEFFNNNDTENVIIGCGHKYHYDCLFTYIKNRNRNNAKCPLCKYSHNHIYIYNSLNINKITFFIQCYCNSERQMYHYSNAHLSYNIYF